jgi:hypothetical protein
MPWKMIRDGSQQVATSEADIIAAMHIKTYGLGIVEWKDGPKPNQVTLINDDGSKFIITVEKKG